MEATIRVMDGPDELVIGFSDIVKYHGGLALMAVAVAFRAQQAAFRELFGEEAPQRKAVQIVSGHAGPGFRDSFEFITRAATRGAYTVDVFYPQAQYDPFRSQSYAFVITGEGKGAVEIALQAHFLPRVFYEYLKKSRDGEMTADDHEAFRELKGSLSRRALALPEDELLTIKRLA